MIRSTLLSLFFLILCAGNVLAQEPVVLFDQGHGQQFRIDRDGPLQLSRLAEIFSESGFKLQKSRAEFTTEILAEVDTLIISGPFATISFAEINVIKNYLRQGGTMAVMLHIAAPATALLQQLGINVSNGAIREVKNLIEGNPLNFSVTEFHKHPLTNGIGSFSAYGCWALLDTPPQTRIAASTSRQAWIDLNGDKIRSPHDAVQSFGIVVTGQSGKGRFAVFGDDAMFQNRFLQGGNIDLADNLVRWLRPDQHKQIAFL